MTFFHIVIGRYLEKLDWLFTILTKYQDAIATVYNDGDIINIPDELKHRIKIIPEDKIQTETTKYLLHILNHWDDHNENERLVFLQGDPLYHNPTILNVFDHVDKWNKNYQNLTLYPHPPSHNWGCAKEIENGVAPNITFFAENARVWCDTNMSETFRGEYFTDNNWLSETLDPKNITVTDMCNEFGLNKPNRNLLKTYSGLFSTHWNHIKKHPKSVWSNMRNFIINGNNNTYSMSQRDRGIYIEYMWSVVLYDDE